jgi:hypothetical protein
MGFFSCVAIVYSEVSPTEKRPCMRVAEMLQRRNMVCTIAYKYVDNLPGTIQMTKRNVQLLVNFGGSYGH